MAVSLRDVLILATCVLVHLAYRNRRRSLLPLPPSPLPRWPLIGNALSMPTQHAHIFFKDLGERCGTKIMHLEALGRPILVLNDIKMAQDLLDKRSAFYSSRPEIPMLNEVVGFTSFFSMMPYGDQWRIHRRMFQQYFSEKNLPRMREKQLEFIRKGLLPNFFQAPDEFVDHIRNCIGGLSISITHGLPVQRQHDPLIHQTEQALHDAAATASPGKYLVNTFPELKHVPEWMPGAGFHKVARKVRKELEELMNGPYKATLDSIKGGFPQESFVADTLDRYRDQPDFELQAFYTKETALQVFSAVAETTVSATITFILAMLKYPDVQRRAQQEVDSIVGQGQLPDFSDVERLKYLPAVVKEVLRWNTPVPVGVPHLTSNEDVYNGYYIPKNCMVIANAYAMLHDDKLFPDPAEFKPERFLNHDGTIRTDIPDPAVVGTFGFGRRICPGKHVALAMLHMTFASILYLFDISPAFDDEGKEIDVKPEFLVESNISNPLPFKCKITPRKGKDIENLLQEYFGTNPI